MPSSLGAFGERLTPSRLGIARRGYNVVLTEFLCRNGWEPEVLGGPSTSGLLTAIT